MRRVQRRGALETGKRHLVPLQGAQGAAPIVPGDEKIGAQRHHPLIIFQRLFGAFQFQQQAGAVEQAFQKIGPRRQRPVIERQRLLAPGLPRQKVAQIDQHFRRRGLFQDLAIQPLGFRLLAGFLRRQRGA